ncbi:MAG: ABC1 kinase family protein [Syntrophomonadaceae bacterium]|jgi:ubiquinone biosynthesis protein|nr:AarF/ABC1/UbiB kinase family protein [Syntrophomonadaceae bacterium]HQD90941.1 AarF/ABC1/UbiB kinase family protein [Syntrophomonadaceae bacterium]
MFGKRFSKVSHLPRYREVANVLIKHGFGFVFDRFTLIKLNHRQIKTKQQVNLRSPYVARHLREAFEELGPAFVKLGQLLSVRPDLLTEPYVAEFEKLQDAVPPFPYEQVVELCREEGLIIDDLFASFEPEPIAAASMGQVHEAYLKTGEHVVVKIQRPNIEEQVKTDLEIMMELAKLLEKRTRWGRLYKVSEIVAELSKAIINELDFHKEARNADNFFRLYREDPTVRIPRIHWQYSTKRVLVMEYVGGIKISDLEELKKANYDPKLIASRLIDALFRQVYENRLFHADPHPGNIAVAEGEIIVFYDFGQVGVVEYQAREKYVELLIGMMRYDTDAVTKAILDIGITEKPINRDDLRSDVNQLQQKYYGMPLSQINVVEASTELINLSVKYKMRLPAELSLLSKMLMTVESIVTQLDPQISLVDLAEPYGRKVLARKMSPDQIVKVLTNVFWDYAELARSYPRHLDKIMAMLANGELKIRMEHANLRRLASRIDILSNRLSLAIILASIIIGSSLVVENSSSNILGRIPLVELGFITALILGLFLVYSIIRSGRY